MFVWLMDFFHIAAPTRRAQVEFFSTEFGGSRKVCDTDEPGIESVFEEVTRKGRTNVGLDELLAITFALPRQVWDSGVRMK